MLSDSWKYHQIKEIKCQEKASKKTRDKTPRDKETKAIVYQVIGEIETREAVIEVEKIKAGRFILATNILDKKSVSNEEI